MRLTTKQRQDVADLVSEYGVGTQSPEQAAREALSAILIGEAQPIAFEVVEAAGVEWVVPHIIWAREEPCMTPETAREIIKQAIADETWEAEPPDDDDAAISDAQQLVKMAEDAWAANVRGPEVEAILKIAANDPEAEEAPTKKAKPAAKPKGAAKPATRPKPKAAEPEPEPEPAALEEPWEDYDSDKVAEIVEGVEVWAENEEHDAILQVYLYELANKNRKNIIAACLAALPEEMVPSDEVPEEPETAPEEPEEAPEAEVEIPEEWNAEPFETYDTLKVPDIREALDEFFQNEEYSEEDKLNTLGHVTHYESNNKARSGLITYLEGIRAAYEEAQGEQPEGEAPEEGEAEGAAAPEADAPAAKRPARGAASGKKAAPATGEGDPGDGATYTVKATGLGAMEVSGPHGAAGCVADMLQSGATTVTVTVVSG